MIYGLIRTFFQLTRIPYVNHDQWCQDSNLKKCHMVFNEDRRIKTFFGYNDSEDKYHNLSSYHDSSASTNCLAQWGWHKTLWSKEYPEK